MRQRRATPSTVHGLFLRAASLWPSHVAVEQDGERLTYAELERRSARIAHRLARSGVEQGDLVGICMRRSPTLIAALLGILRAGAAYVPLDATYPRDRLDMVAADAGLTAVVVDAGTRSELALPSPVDAVDRRPASSLADVPVLLSDDLLGDGQAAGGIEPTEAADGALRSYVIFTSGSTGRPKGVEVTHRNVVNLLGSLAQRPGLREGEALLALTTISFDIHVLELFLPLAVGATILLLSSEDSRDPGAVIRVFERHRPALVQATPAQWRMLVHSGFRGHPKLRIVIGGEALTRPMADALLPLCEELWNAYGPTETTVWSAVGRVERHGPILLSGLVDATSFHVVDPSFDPLRPGAVATDLDAEGTVGELWIGGAGVTQGYIGRPDLTRQRFLRDPFGPEAGVERAYRTGDLVRRHASGGLEFLGRTDFQVKIRGFRVELGEVEAALDSSPEVRHAVAVAVPDPTGEHKLVAYVELVPGSDPSGILAHVRTKVPPFMVPSQVVALERMPMTPNGKIDRNALPAPPTDRAGAGVAWVEPQDGAEAAIADVFAAVLGLDEVGAADSFFDLGGTSVMVPETLRRLEGALAAPVSLPGFLRAPTPRDLAATLGHAAESGDEILARARRDALVTEGDRGEIWEPAASDPTRTLFVTGASGFVGAHILERLLETGSVERVIALVRAEDEDAAYRRIGDAFARYDLAPERWRRRVSVVVGDVAAPLLGLSPATFERIAVEADAVLHAASSVNLLYPYEVMREANVEGTREIVRLASTGRPKPIHYTSSLDVFLDPGLHPAPAGSHRETAIASPDGLPRGYEISKWAAETLLINAAEAFGLQVSILRIGMVVGHSDTGVGHETDEWHRLLCDAVELRALPDMEVSFRAVPVDWLGSVVAHLVRTHRPAAGRPDILHLNPGSGIGIEDVARELSSFLEAPVALIEPEQWFEAIRSNPAAALYPLLELFAEGDPAEGRNYLQISTLGAASYATTRLEAALAHTDLAPLRYDAGRLRRSLEFLERTGKVARPGRVAHALAVT